MSSEGGPKLQRIAPAVSQSIIDELFLPLVRNHQDGPGFQ